VLLGKNSTPLNITGRNFIDSNLRERRLQRAGRAACTLTEKSEECAIMGPKGVKILNRKERKKNGNRNGLE